MLERSAGLLLFKPRQFKSALFLNARLNLDPELLRNACAHRLSWSSKNNVNRNKSVFRSQEVSDVRIASDDAQILIIISNRTVRDKPGEVATLEKEVYFSLGYVPARVVFSDPFL